MTTVAVVAALLPLLLLLILQTSCPLVDAWTSHVASGYRRGAVVVGPARAESAAVNLNRRTTSTTTTALHVSTMATPQRNAPSKRKTPFAKNSAHGKRQKKEITFTNDKDSASSTESSSPTRPTTRPRQAQQVASLLGFRRGTPVVVEVVNFGPLGASVRVIGTGHVVGDNLPQLEHEATTTMVKGLILQREIHLFRQGRKHVDVYRGEVLNAYVERIRDIDHDGLLKLDICLRTYGSLPKTNEASCRIWKWLQELNDASADSTTMIDGLTPCLPIGHKSSRQEIGRFFPGMSKVTFKRALTVLEDQDKICSDDCSVRLKHEALAML